MLENYSENILNWFLKSLKIILLNQNIKCTILYEQRLKPMICLKTTPSTLTVIFWMITWELLRYFKLFKLFEHGEVITITFVHNGTRFGY